MRMLQYLTQRSWEVLEVLLFVGGLCGITAEVKRCKDRRWGKRLEQQPLTVLGICMDAGQK